jgi:hypothetical protein
MDHLLVAVDGTFSMNMDFMMQASAGFSQSLDERYVINPKSIGTVTIPIGPVPVTISAFIGLKVSDGWNVMEPLCCMMAGFKV